MKSKSKSKGKSGNKAQQSFASSRSQNSSSQSHWNKGNANNGQSYSRSSSGYDTLWGESDDPFPALGASAPVPKVNVWEERKAKMESVQALQPQSEYDEEAMLQQALALSLLEEEERKRKEEEEFKLQMETAVFENIEDEEYISSISESDLSEPKCEVFKEKENVSRNTVSNFCQKDKPLSSGGAKPKINKIIDSFGGWGLKDKKKNNSGKLSEFVNNIVDETVSKHPKKHSVSNYESCYRNKTVGIERNENINSMENSWPSEVKKQIADSDPEVLYNEQGTFTDLDDITLNEPNITKMNEASELSKCVSPNKALDTWLNSDNNEDWQDRVSNNKPLVNDCARYEEVNCADVPISIPLNTYLSNSENSKDDCISTSANMYESNFRTDSGSARRKISDTFDVALKHENLEENSWINNNEEITLRKSNTQTNNDHDSTKVSHSFELAQTSFKSNDIWGDTSTTSYFPSVSETLPSTKHNDDKTSIQFSSNVQNEFLDNMSDEQSDLPPILPPKPAPVVSEKEEENAILDENKTSNPISQNELPYAPPSQFLPGFQNPFSVMNHPLLNPTASMLPGLDPRLACGLDPIAMRQMLILSNPFFANQLCAMEQYYRAMGVPVDLFSFPSVPNVVAPGMLNMGLSPLGSFPNTANAFMQTEPLHSQLNPLDNSLFSSESQNNNNNNNTISELKSVENSVQSSKLVVDVSSASLENSSQNKNDSWYKSFLSSDCSEAIPPPKPSSYSNSDPNFPSVSKPPELNQCDSQFNKNNLVSNDYASNSSASYIPPPTVDNNYHKSLSAVESCMTKTEVTGWSDPEDEVVSAHKPKTFSGWEDDDDGWGNIVPTKSVKNTSNYDDKKVCRQPIRQPQVSRQPVRQPQLSQFQRNKPR